MAYAVVQALERRCLLSAGQLDPTFGHNGIVGGFNDLFPGGAASALVIQKDGRIVIAGQSSPDNATSSPLTPVSHPALIRLNTDGSLDPTFGVAGRFTQPLGQSQESISALAIQPDGKLVAAGYSGNDFFVARFLANGSLDGSFGRDGFTLTSFAANDGANALALQPDGKIVVVGSAGFGSASSNNQSTSFAIARYTSSGLLDQTFGVAGKVVESINAQPNLPNYSIAYSVAIDGKGRIVVGGTDASSNLAIIRLTPGGLPDQSFGTSGVASPIGDYKGSQANSVSILPDGKILAAGDDGSDMVLARLDSAGKLDRSFAKAGIFTAALPDFTQQYSTPGDAANAANATGNAMALQRDGKIIVVGYVSGSGTHYIAPQRFAIVRITRSGQLDRGFGDKGEVETNTGNLWETDVNEANAVAVQSDGRIVVAGSGYAVGNGLPTLLPGEILAVRYTPSGKLDRTFGDGGRVGSDPSGLASGAQKIAIQSDGRVIVAADLHTLARFSNAGMLDPTFGFRGRVLPATDMDDLIGSSYEGVGQILVQPDGKILLGGYINNASQLITLVRYNVDGSLDRSFGHGGFASTDLSTNKFNQDSPYLESMALQADGKIVVAAVGQIRPGFTILRYTRTGALDRSFGTRGVVDLKAVGGSNNVAAAVIVEADGHILAGGTAYPTAESVDNSPGSGFVISRLNSNGSLDTTFGNGGSVVTNDNSFAALDSMRLLSDGTLVATGTTPSGFAIAHYTAQGQLDRRFGFAGEVTSSFHGTQRPSVPMLIAPDGSTFVPDNYGISRYTPGGFLDASFNASNLAQFVNPMDLALDGNGNVVIAATGGADGSTTLLRVLT